MPTMSNTSSENERASCPYCAAEQPDYDLDCYDCRTRFRIWSYQLGNIKAHGYCERGSRIVSIREEPEE